MPLTKACNGLVQTDEPVEAQRQLRNGLHLGADELGLLKMKFDSMNEKECLSIMSVDSGRTSWANDALRVEFTDVLEVEELTINIVTGDTAKANNRFFTKCTDLLDILHKVARTGLRKCSEDG